MIIDCIADLHGYYPKLEGGDLLIVAGDLTARDEEYEYTDRFLLWLIDLHMTKYKKIIWIGGNHDNWIQKNISIEKQFAGGEYLCDSGTEFEGLKIWGSPWTKTFEGMNPKCKAFTVDTEEELAEKWALIPSDVDILVTHSPPYTILDAIERGDFLPEASIYSWTEQVGSTTLLIEHLNRIKPRLWVWGHIHESYGIDGPYTWNKTQYVNASHVNEHYQPVNKPIRIEL